MDEVKVAAVVSSFNRLSLLQVGLPTLYQALLDCPFASAIIVYDAGSTDGSREWVRAFHADSEKVSVAVIEPGSGEDTSFSAGVNTACGQAAAWYQNLRYFLFFETDNWIKSAEPIILAAQLLENEEKLAAVGFTVSNHSGAKIGYGCSFPTVSQFLLGQHVTCLLHLDEPKPHWNEFNQTRWTLCDVVFTSPILVRKKAWDASKGFEPHTFPFSDCDTDWCWRLSKIGWKLAVLDVEGVVHDNQEQLSSWSQDRTRRFHQARLKFFIQTRGDWVRALRPLLSLRHCLEYGLLLLLVLLKKRPAEMLKARGKLISGALFDYS